MNKEQQRIAIAELCGYKRGMRRVGTPFEGPAWLIPNGKAHHPHEWVGVDNFPDYTEDLNAMHEAEKVMTPHQRQKYRNALWVLCPDDEMILSATAEQRAEAFIRSIGKWVEGKE